MNASIKFFLIVAFIFCLTAIKVSAQNATEEWIDIEVVVNVLDGADANGVEDAIAKVNEILAPAKIRLVKKATNPNAFGDCTMKFDGLKQLRGYLSRDKIFRLKYFFISKR